MHKPILDSRAKTEAAEFLNSWATSFLALEEIFDIKRKEVSNRNYAFLKIIGESVYYINLFNSFLVKKLESYNSNLNDESIEKLSNFIRFFTSLISSKIKYFFFRETPVINTNNPFVDWNWDIYTSADVILDKIYRNEIDNTLKKNLVIFFFNLTLVYSFVYDSTKSKGIFFRYKKNKNQFTDLKKMIEDRIAPVHNEVTCRVFGTSILSSIAQYYNNSFNATNEQERNKATVYSKLFATLNKDNNLYIEPYTTHLSDIMWKAEGMVNSDDEFFTSDCKENHDSKIINLIKTFVSDYLHLGDENYRSEKNHYVKQYDLTSEFITDLYALVLRPRLSDTVRSQFIKFNSYYSKLEFTSDVYTTSNRIPLSDCLADIRHRSEKDFKTERLIELLTKDQLLNLFSLYKGLTRIDLIENERTQLVAFFESGVILAHIINQIYKTNKPVWIFKTKPYVATHPIHTEASPNFDYIIAFDDCIKTSFTYSLYEAYLMRNLHGANIETHVQALFKFDYYKTINSCYSLNDRYICDINHNFLPLQNEEVSILNRDISDFKLEIPKLNKNQLINAIHCLITNEDKQCSRIDMTSIFSNTLTFLGVCNYFKEQIIDKFNTSDTHAIYIFSPSSDGNVLSVMTALLLKLENIPVTFTQSSELQLRVSIDLSIETGLSFAKAWFQTKNGYYELNQTYNDAAVDFDLILVINGHKAIAPEATSLIDLHQ